MDSDDQQGLLVGNKTRNSNNNMVSSSSTTGFCYTDDVPSNNQIQNHSMNQIQQTFSRAVVHQPEIFNNLTPANMENFFTATTSNHGNNNNNNDENEDNGGEGDNENDDNRNHLMETMHSAASWHHENKRFNNDNNNSNIGDDSLLRCVFTCEGNERPSQGLSLSLSSTNPSSIGLQSFELRQQQQLGSSKKEKILFSPHELQKRKSKLLSMLDEDDKRYKHYCDQMKAGVSPFEAVAGNGAAKVYSALASRAMSMHFRCLRYGIVGQIQEANKAMGEKDTASVVAPGTTKGETPRLRLLDRTLRQQRAIQQMSLMESHPWRPQRGLPERSVSVLRAWLFEHFLHPYPSDVDKHILACQTGLSRSQACPLKDRFLFSALLGFFVGGCACVSATPPTASANLEYAWKERGEVHRAKVPAIVTGVVVAVICVALFLYRILKARTKDKVTPVPV